MEQSLEVAAATHPLPSILQGVKHDTRALLQERMETLFQSADDALFEMADRASTDTDQNLYFDSMRIVRLQRARIQQRFLDNYSRSWSGMQAQDGEIYPAANPVDELEADDFSLVQNDELEISVAAAGISSKVTSMFLLPLTQLSKRLEAVCDHEVEPARNPLGPQRLNESFIQAIDGLEVHIKVRIILLKLFERFVAEQLEAVYERANKVLIEAGVLPELKHRINPRRTQPTTRTTPDAPSNTGTPVAPRGHEQFIGLQDLLQHARTQGVLAQTAPAASANRPTSSQGGSYVGEEHGAATIVSTPELMQILGAVQGEASNQPIDLSAPQPALDLRRVVIDAAVGEHKKERLDDVSGDVVDLVRMLFDYILNDRNLAIPMKALIGRLQIPILKVALLDKSFFGNSGHPARQLLNELSSAGIGWSSATELKRDATYNKIESIVERVLGGFSDDLRLFSNLIVELRHFVSKEARKRNQVEQRVRETESGKARTREAKRTVQAIVNQRACGLRMPTHTGRFVSDSWSRVLIYLYVTQGSDSEAWTHAIATLEDLLWASQPQSTEDDVARREGLLPELVTQLEAGITLANLSDAQEQLDAVRETIENLHQSDLAYLDSERLPELGFEVESQPELVLIEQPKTEEAAPAEIDSIADAAFVDAIIALEPGCWAELKNDDGKSIRCKLATVVQPGNRYVWVNRKGMKICERARNTLALALQNDDMRLLDESEVFERALEAVIGNLRRMQATPQEV